MIDAFADLTNDHHFIHVDPVRAAAQPMGRTIAHGFLTLSLLSRMSYQVCPRIESARYALNYGFDRVRFVQPVPVDSRVRGRFVLRSAQATSTEQLQVVYGVTMEIDGQTRPAIVAEWLTRSMV